MKNETRTTATVRRDGMLLWTRTEGPKSSTRYAERRVGQTEPSGWELWSSTQREAGGYAGTGDGLGHMGLGR